GARRRVARDPGTRRSAPWRARLRRDRSRVSARGPHVVRLAVACLLAGAAFAAPRHARAEEMPATSWYESLTMNGFVSSSYSYNLEKPPSHMNTLRVFDFDD